MLSSGLHQKRQKGWYAKCSLCIYILFLTHSLTSCIFMFNISGLCSAHGPARKRCSVEGCPKVAVQAGRCIAHGAKKKVCCHVHEQGGSQVQCTKQAILGGYCKRHYDEVHGVVKQRKTRAPKDQGEVGNPNHKPGHERGLSLFQDSDLMETIINNGNDGSGGTPELAEEDGLRGAKFVH